MNNIRKIGCLLIIMSGAIALQGQALSKIFTIDEAVKRVLNSYPSVDQAEEAIKRAEYNVRMAQAAFYPMISGSAAYA